MQADAPIIPIAGGPDMVVGDIAGLEPVRMIRRRWPTWLGAMLTVAMVVALGRELLGDGLVGLSRATPRDPRFYLCFAALYMALPIGDFVIFRRLWGIPAVGLIALVKKRIANEVLLNYTGEAYFYAWARARRRMVTAPFGAVKDVSILSALAGNAITLAMLGLAVPLGHRLLPADTMRLVLASAAVTVAVSLVFLLFSRRVFSLARRILWWIFAVHCLRLVAGSVLIALAWHFAMPQVSPGMWLFLAAARLLVSRLPLVPNKDLFFASFAILLIGQDQALSELVAFTAALFLLTHGVLIAMFGVSSLARKVVR